MIRGEVETSGLVVPTDAKRAIAPGLTTAWADSNTSPDLACDPRARTCLRDAVAQVSTFPVSVWVSSTMTSPTPESGSAEPVKILTASPDAGGENGGIPGLLSPMTRNHPDSEFSLTA